MNHKRPQQLTIKSERAGADERTEKAQFLSWNHGMCGAGFKQESDSSIWGEVGKKDFIPGTFVLGPVLMFQLILLPYLSQCCHPVLLDDGGPPTCLISEQCPLFAFSKSICHTPIAPVRFRIFKMCLPAHNLLHLLTDIIIPNI